MTTVRRLGWRACYELLASRIPAPDWAFMNYGYAPLGPEATRLRLEPADEPDRLCIQLYEHAVAEVDLSGLDVLEVGSGRGGGSSYLARYRRPHSMTGLDFSARAVALSRRHRRAPGLSFVRGDAQSMPFGDGRFDAVVNVESSHCYSSMPRFLAEVRRVLRPGGSLYFADFRSRDAAAELGTEIARSGLRLVREGDITANVLAALELDNARKLALIDELVPRLVRRSFRAFAGVRGTKMHAGFQSGTLRYLTAQTTRPSGRGR